MSELGVVRTVLATAPPINRRLATGKANGDTDAHLLGEACLHDFPCPRCCLNQTLEGAKLSVNTHHHRHETDRTVWTKRLATAFFALSLCLTPCQIQVVNAGDRGQSNRPRHGNAPPVIFEDGTDQLHGFTHASNGGDAGTGVAWLDYNNDGKLDFYVANGIGHHDGLMRNNGDGSFTNVIATSGMSDGNGSSGVVAGDLNNDGHTDLIVAGEPAALVLFVVPSQRSIRVFRNNGNGSFSDVTAESGVVIPNVAGAAMQPVLGDIDNDGLLDVFVSGPGSVSTQQQLPSHLFRNLGGFKFQDISEDSGVEAAVGACAAAFSHYDQDGLIDLYIADCASIVGSPTALRLLKNNGNLTFTDITQQVDLPNPNPQDPQLGQRGYWMCVALGDYDNDTDMDLFATNLGLLFSGDLIPFFANQPHGFFERNTDGTFISVESQVGIHPLAEHFGWGGSFADFNNDGWEDLIFAGNIPQPPFGQLGNPGYLFINQGNKTFRRDELPVNLGSKFSTGLATADYNNDGFVDVVISNGAYTADPNPTPVLLKNCPNRNSWLTIRLVGTDSNRSAVGARVQLELPGRILTKEVRAGSSFLSQDSPWLTFGLNKSRRVNRMKIIWPSGLVEQFVNIRSRRILTVVEGQGIQ